MEAPKILQGWRKLPNNQSKLINEWPDLVEQISHGVDRLWRNKKAGKPSNNCYEGSRSREETKEILPTKKQVMEESNGKKRNQSLEEPEEVEKEEKMKEQKLKQILHEWKRKGKEL